MKIGDPPDPDTQMGPQASKADFEHAMKYVDIGKKDGAKIVVGGERHDIGTGKGYFMQPTIFRDVDNSMQIAQEEVFGPVLSVIPYGRFDPAASLGGYKMSGYGRELGADTLDAYTQTKTVWMNYEN